MRKKINDKILAFKSKYNEQDGRRAIILLYFQIVLSSILVTLAIMLLILQHDTEILYFSLVVSLLIVQLIAIVFNSSGKYKISALITMICAIVGPWVSILFDESVRMGDVLPIMYIVLVIILSSIFLTIKITLILTLIQFVAVTIFCLSSPALLEQNIASLFSFFVIAAVLVGLSSYINQKQLEQIENQNLKYLEKEKEMRELLIHDNMTGLYNRAYINEIIHSIESSAHFSVFMFDIDGLKGTNDNFGHLEGDQLIISTAKVIKKCFKETDIVGRIGGDEFIAILPGTDEESAENIRKEIEEIINKYNLEYSKNHLSIHLSYGCASSTSENNSIERLMKIADDQMYTHKKSKL
ncbi:MAG: GGDEF domain-containing protein [Candidatus Izemoplasmatales bacterium]|jgi:diguanylate cyclase (GGDEF)-like protein|nr:GGDEF domain-containing protein [Candidatus Izemoplasmatales bacterium]